MSTHMIFKAYADCNQEAESLTDLLSAYRRLQWGAGFQDSSGVKQRMLDKADQIRGQIERRMKPLADFTGVNMAPQPQDYYKTRKAEIGQIHVATSWIYAFGAALAVKLGWDTPAPPRIVR